MKNNRIIVEKYIQIYSKEEFEFIITLCPSSKLHEPIKSAPKKFREEISGFRTDKVPIKKLQDIYYKRIFKQKDELLAVHIDQLISVYLKKIEGHISEVIDSAEIVRTKIENNDMEYFEKLTTVLLDNKFKEKEHVVLYFKMIDYELTNDQNNYMNIDFVQKLEYRKIESQIKKNITVTYDNKVREMEETNKILILRKNIQIDLLKQNIEESKRISESELSTKNIIISNMEEENKKLWEEFSLEIESYKDKMRKLESLSDELIYENSEKENLIVSLSEVVELKHNEFSKIADEKWIQSNEQLFKERRKFQLCIDELEVTKERILKEINDLYHKKSQLEDNILSYENKAGVIVENIQCILKAIGFSRNNNQNMLYRIPSIQLETELEKINDKLDFIEDLNTNLVKCGINNEYSFDLACYMFATFANKMSLLLVGYNTRKIADAISYIINGTSAEIITLSLGYNDCNELIEMVNRSNSEVILIENAVDNISESVYIPLIKQNKDKFILFALESSEHISLIPESILNYLMLVDLDILLGFENDSGLYQSGITNKDIFEVKIESSSNNINYSHIKELDNIKKLSKVSKFKMAEVMSLIDKLNSKNAMYDILLFSINMLLKSNDKTDEFKEFINNQDFNPMILKMLLSATGNDVDDE